MMQLLGWLGVIAAFVVLLLWATRNLNGKSRRRCPTCGVDLTAYPHKPRCNYWRN